jgi:pyruvate/2-oxoglutarate dehydrogenase complex dihydrolipoamide dehydrogenase (E3) component
MSKYSHDLIVIGGGAAGLTLTSGAAQLGMKTALIEREHMGGDCLYFGCVPSKSLLKSSSVWDQISRTTELGLPTLGNLPPVDAVPLMSRIQEVIGNIAYHDSPERFRSLGAEVYLGNPRFTSEHEVEVETSDGLVKLSAPKLTIATGSSALIIPFPGLEKTSYLTNREIFNISSIPAKLLVVGSGPIGIELGQAMANLGSEVTILTNSNQILPVEDDDMTLPVKKILEKKGVKIIFNAGITKVSAISGRKKVEYRAADEISSWEGDEILMATGRRGNIDNLNLEKAGIETNGRYIKVDSSLRTNRKHIMAIGDVNGKFQFTHVAGTEGGIAVRRQVLGLPASMSYTNVPWVTYVKPEIASIGYNEKRAEAAGLNYKIVETEFSLNDRAQAEGEISGRIKILINRKDVVIGTQIAGPHAGELISPAIYAVSGKWKISKLYSPIMPYPTLTEIYKKAIGGYIGGRLFNSRTRNFLKFTKGYRGTGPI